MIKMALALAALVAVVLVICGIELTAQAHDHSRPALDSWYNGLAAGKGLCCSGSEAQPVADPDWESVNGHYRVRLNDVWVEVPNDAVVTGPNLDGRTLVWAAEYQDGSPFIRCFMPGAMT